MSDETINQAIAAIKAGDKEHAKQLLLQVLEVDEDNEDAWLAMAACVDDLGLKRECLEWALEINPHSELAKRGMRRLDRTGSAEPVPRAKKRKKKAKKRAWFRNRKS